MTRPHPKVDSSPIQLTPKDIARFWSKVDKTPGQGPQGDCWEWKGWRFKRPDGSEGYGGFGVSYRDLTAHRVAFFTKHGRWPEPFGCHTCDNPPCCNPDHVWEGTHDDNMADCKAKGRNASGERSGMRLHPERVARGERHGAAKLTAAKVAQAREWRSEGWTYKKISTEFGVDISTIARIFTPGKRERRNWETPSGL